MSVAMKPYLSVVLALLSVVAAGEASAQGHRSGSVEVASAMPSDDAVYFESIAGGVFAGPSVAAVLDSRASRVTLIHLPSLEASFLGQAGQGPGEFERPTEIRYRSDTIFVAEAGGRLTSFPVDGSSPATHSGPNVLPARTAWWLPMRGGAFVAVEAATVGGAQWPPPVPTYRALLIDADGRQRVRLGEAGAAMVRVDGSVHPVPAVVPPQLQVVPVGDSAVVIMDGYSGEGERYDVHPSGAISVHRLPSLPVSGAAVGEDGIRRMRVAALAFRGETRPLSDVEVSAPSATSVVARAGIDEFGRIWVCTRSAGRAQIRVLSRSGQWSDSEFPVEFIPLAMRAGRVLAYSEDELGVLSLFLVDFPLEG